jgi:3-deoxy-7-phosphoheptulonate synthase
MIIILKAGSEEKDAQYILEKIKDAGLEPLYMPGVERIVLGAIGDERVLATLHLESYEAVEDVRPVLSPYKLVSREVHHQDSVVSIGKSSFGNGNFSIMAGPCSIETADQIERSAKMVKDAGLSVLRGGAYKPRTSPYSFQGLGEEGLEYMAAASRKYNLACISEVMDVHEIDTLSAHVDALQIGARNMQNYRLLQAVGQQDKPVLLKRGMSASVEELLLAAEYIYKEGNHRIILCERGIRTFETATRNTLDLNAVAYLKEKSHLPVIVDPSHGTGVRSLVIPMALAAVGAGADGLMIEAHPNPEQALSDGQQSLDEEDLGRLLEKLQIFVAAAGKTMN